MHGDVFDEIFTGQDKRQNYEEDRFIKAVWLGSNMTVIGWTPRGETRRIMSMGKANGSGKGLYAKLGLTPMSSENRALLEDFKTLKALIQLMWDASDLILAVCEYSDLGSATRGDQSPVPEADLAACQILVGGLAALTPN